MRNWRARWRKRAVPSSNAHCPILVTGATSIVGSLLVPMLAERNLPVICLGRTPVATSSTVSWRCFDFETALQDVPVVRGETLIHTAGIWLLPRWLDSFHGKGLRRLVAFSSTSRFTKQSSVSAEERELAHRLALAENATIESCQRLGIQWTILRPTLIYGGLHGDRNVEEIARVIRRFRMFPILGAAKGLRQPVNAKDLAMACLQVLAVPRTCDKAYNLSGGETLAYSEMVRRIFGVLGYPPMLLPVPISIFRAAVWIARHHPRFRHLTAGMAVRMQEDLVFDHHDASVDFGYQPAPFDPTYLVRPR